MKDSLKFKFTAIVWAIILFAIYGLAIHSQRARIHADDYTTQSISELDASFGNGGKVMTGLEATAAGSSLASDIAIQNDAELFVARGVFDTSGGSSAPNSCEFGLARF